MRPAGSATPSSEVGLERTTSSPGLALRYTSLADIDPTTTIAPLSNRVSPRSAPYGTSTRSRTPGIAMWAAPLFEDDSRRAPGSNRMQVVPSSEFGPAGPGTATTASVTQPEGVNFSCVTLPSQVVLLVVTTPTTLPKTAGFGSSNGCGGCPQTKIRTTTATAKAMPSHPINRFVRDILLAGEAGSCVPADSSSAVSGCSKTSPQEAQHVASRLYGAAQAGQVASGTTTDSFSGSMPHVLPVCPDPWRTGQNRPTPFVPDRTPPAAAGISRARVPAGPRSRSSPPARCLAPSDLTGR